MTVLAKSSSNLTDRQTFKQSSSEFGDRESAVNLQPTLASGSQWRPNAAKGKRPGVAAVKIRCETVASQRRLELLNAEAEESTALGAVTRQQPVKIQQTEKIKCVKGKVKVKLSLYLTN
jgi:hypothetical protein